MEVNSKKKNFREVGGGEERGRVTEKREGERRGREGKQREAWEIEFYFLLLIERAWGRRGERESKERSRRPGRGRAEREKRFFVVK